VQALDIAQKANPAQRTNEPINAWLMNTPSINETECIGTIKAIVANRHAGTQQRDSTILEFMRMMLRLDVPTKFPSVTKVPYKVLHGVVCCVASGCGWSCSCCEHSPVCLNSVWGPFPQFHLDEFAPQTSTHFLHSDVPRLRRPTSTTCCAASSLA